MNCCLLSAGLSVVFSIQVQKDIGSNIGLVKYGMRLKVDWRRDVGCEKFLKTR